MFIGTNALILVVSDQSMLSGGRELLGLGVLGKPGASGKDGSFYLSGIKIRDGTMRATSVFLKRVMSKLALTTYRAPCC